MDPRPRQNRRRSTAITKNAATISQDRTTTDLTSAFRKKKCRRYKPRTLGNISHLPARPISPQSPQRTTGLLLPASVLCRHGGTLKQVSSPLATANTSPRDLRWQQLVSASAATSSAGLDENDLYQAMAGLCAAKARSAWELSDNTLHVVRPDFQYFRHACLLRGITRDGKFGDRADVKGLSQDVGGRRGVLGERPDRLGQRDLSAGACGLDMVKRTCGCSGARIEVQGIEDDLELTNGRSGAGGSTR